MGGRPSAPDGSMARCPIGESSRIGGRDLDGHQSVSDLRLSRAARRRFACKIAGEAAGDPRLQPASQADRRNDSRLGDRTSASNRGVAGNPIRPDPQGAGGKLETNRRRASQRVPRAAAGVVAGQVDQQASRQAALTSHLAGEGEEKIEAIGEDLIGRKRAEDERGCTQIIVNWVEAVRARPTPLGGRFAPIRTPNVLNQCRQLTS